MFYSYIKAIIQFYKLQKKMAESITCKEDNTDSSLRDATLQSTFNLVQETGADLGKEQPGSSEEMLDECPGGANNDDDCDDEQGEGNSKESTETQDEYSYTKRDPSSSELYKVFIKNIRSHFGFRVSTVHKSCEPAHEIMVVFTLRKLILQMCMHSHPGGLGV